MFYFSLFLIFLYFKIARVHKKEEASSPIILVQHIIVALSAIAIYSYGFSHFDIIKIIAVSFLFFIVAALIITAIQLGVFVDGKPILGISKVYKFLPVLSATIAFLAILL
jgi:hypothetical protein